MRNPLTSIPAIETVLIRLSIKLKQLIYQIARLDYRIFKRLAMLEKVDDLIVEEVQNIKSLDAAIKAAGKGKVTEKLIAWKVKAEYKLFKLNIRKNKIDLVKIIINQSKLQQHKEALISIENDIKTLEAQKQKLSPPINEDKKETGENIFIFWEKARQLKEQDPLHRSIKAYLNEVFQMAS